MLAEVPIEEFLDLIAETAATLTGHPFAAVMLLDEEETRLIAKGAAGLTRDYVERLNSEFPVIVGGDAPASRAFRTGEPVIVHMTEESLGQWADLAVEQGYASIASVPLPTAAGQIGALNVYATQRAEFSRSEVTLLKALATDAAAAIQVVQLRASEHQTIAELEQSDRMYQALNNVALTDEGLDPITRALASMTGRRIAIEEIVSESLLSAHPAERPSGSHLDELRARILASADTGVGNFPSTHEAESETGDVLSLVPVALGPDVVAYLWAFGDGGMTPLQQRVLERGAVVVALELLKQRHAREVEWRMRGDLLEDLLTVTEEDEARVLERARGFGHDFMVPHVMIVVRPDVAESEAKDDSSKDRGEHVLQRIVSATQAVAGGSPITPLIGTRSGFVVLLWPVGMDVAQQPSQIADSVRRYVASRTRTTVSICLGDICDSILEHRACFQLAVGALRLMQTGGRRDQVISLDDLGIFRLLLSVDDPAALRAYAERVLGPLRGYDDARQGDLVHTLEGYLQNDLNTARTAAALHVHANTLTYRLRRIEKLAGIRLRNAEDLLQVSLALCIERIAPRTPAS
jgi:sugar diacid utilization regulator/GAF domain-containing protein